MSTVKGYVSPARDVLLLGALAVVVGGFLIWLVTGGSFAVDFRFAYLPAAHDVVNGLNPYPAPTDPSVDAGSAYVYPPLLAVLLVPFTPAPDIVSSVIWVALLLVALGAAIAACGVRDWRCYAAAAIWFPTATAVQTANVSIPLALLAALAWRFRERLGSAVAVGAAIGLKLALAPLLVWLWFRGSRRRAIESVIVGGSLVLAPWAMLGFAGVGGYDDLTRELTRLEGPESYSIYALALSVGLPSWVARALWLGVGLGLVVASALVARRGRDEQSFTLAVFASLALAPIVWLHAYVLLAVPLAIARPRFGPAWLVPLLMWGAPVTDGDGPQTARVLAAAALVLGICLRPGQRAQEGRVSTTSVSSA